MELPIRLRDAISHQLQERNQAALMRSAQELSLRYRAGNARGQRLVTTRDEALSYCITRMPATYGAVYSCLNSILEQTGLRQVSLLDAGAGTGAASWAAAQLLSLKSIVCLEREEALLALGKTLMSGMPESFMHTTWLRQDITHKDFSLKADLVIASYLFNELSPQVRAETALRLFDMAGEVLLLVEPGTPEGFQNLKNIRTLLLDLGAHMVAPCPHGSICPIKENDWCHFACRIPRGKLHRQFKEGEAPFEDEKFAYLAMSKKAYPPGGARILRHPQIRKGYVLLELCTPDGNRTVRLSKKDGERYKSMRKAKAGDLFPTEAEMEPNDRGTEANR